MPMLVLHDVYYLKVTVFYFSSFLWWPGLWWEDLLWTRLVKQNRHVMNQNCAGKFVERQGIWVSLCGVEVKQVLNRYVMNRTWAEFSQWWKAHVQGNVVDCVCDEHNCPKHNICPTNPECSCDKTSLWWELNSSNTEISWEDHWHSPLQIPRGPPSKFLLLFLSNHSFFSSSQPRPKHSRLKYRVSTHLRKHLSNLWTRVNLQPHLQSQFYTKTCRPSRTQCPARTRTQTWLPLWSTIRDWTSPWWIYRNWHEWSIRGMLASTLFRKARGDCGNY